MSEAELPAEPPPSYCYLCLSGVALHRTTGRVPVCANCHVELQLVRLTLARGGTQ
jgi:hypothetical protein